MDSVTNTSDLASQTQISANSLLSLLNGTSGDNEEAQMFANFMAQNQAFNSAADNTSVSASNLQLASTTQASTLPQNIQLSAPQSSMQSMLSLVKNLNSALHNIMDKLQNQNGNKSSSAKSSDANQNDNSSTNAAASYIGAHHKSDKSSVVTSDSNSNSATDSSTSTATAAATAAAAPVTPSYIATASGDSATGATGDAANDQPSITDLLSALERLSQMIEQQLQGNLNGSSGTANSQTGSSDATDANASGTSATTGPLSLAQTLSDLLALSQMAMKQLDGGSAGTDASANATAGLSSVAGSSTPSDAQLMAQLKSLLNNLKTDVAANDETGTAPTLAADAAASTAAGAASEAAVSNLTRNTNGPVISATKDNWIENDSFFNIFSGHDRTVSNQTTTGVAALTTGIAADGAGSKDGASLDMDLDAQANNTAHNSGSLGENATASAALEGSSQTNPYSFASQLSASRATTATLGATGLPTAVEQVILQLSRNVKSGNDQISLQLNPGDLGRVNIKLDMSSDGKVQGTVVADNPTTLGLLQKDVRSLERALQDAGLRADPGSLQFSLGNQAGNAFGQSAGNSSGQTSNQTSGGDSQSGTTSDLATNLAAISSDTTETYYLTPGRVNLRV
jgi:hypothetical protein